MNLSNVTDFNVTEELKKTRRNIAKNTAEAAGRPNPFNQTPVTTSVPSIGEITSTPRNDTVNHSESVNSYENYLDFHEKPEHFTEQYVTSILSGIPARPETVVTPDFNSYTIEGTAYARATRVIEHRTTSTDFKHTSLREWKEDCLLNGFFDNPYLIEEYQQAREQQGTAKIKREIKKEARILGGGEDGVNYGTLIHDIMEAWVANQDKLSTFHKTLPPYLFAALLENIDLFAQHKLKVVSSENVVIISENPPVAGTFDSVVQNSNGEYFIHDYKSTKTSSLPLSLPGYELQMYMYTQAKYLITKKGERIDMPKNLNQDYGYITHTPLDGRARMIKVDYSHAKKELPIVLESFAAQQTRDSAIERLNANRKIEVNYLS